MCCDTSVTRKIRVVTLDKHTIIYTEIILNTIQKIPLFLTTTIDINSLVHPNQMINYINQKYNLACLLWCSMNTRTGWTCVAQVFHLSLLLYVWERNSSNFITKQLFKIKISVFMHRTVNVSSQKHDTWYSGYILLGKLSKQHKGDISVRCLLQRCMLWHLL